MDGAHSLCEILLFSQRMLSFYHESFLKGTTITGCHMPGLVTAEDTTERYRSAVAMASLPVGLTVIPTDRNPTDSSLVCFTRHLPEQAQWRLSQA